jgi:hypothetical protein
MPNEKNSLSSLVKDEFLSLLTIKQTDRLWHIPLLASLCSGIPLLVGYFLDKLQYGILASLAGLVILYLPTGSLINRMTVLMACSFGIMMSFTIGLCFSFNPYISVVAFTIFSFCVQWSVKFSGLRPPGNFFFIMIASIAICSPFDSANIATNIGYVGLGTMMACSLALIYSILMRKKPLLISTDPLTKKSNVHITIEAGIASLFLGGSLLTAHLMHLSNPYWVPISCLAVMQGLNFRQIWQRSIHRIVGTFIGMGLTWLLLSLRVTPLSICISIFILQFIVEMLIVRHYGLAVIFMTPLTLLIAEAGHAMSLAPDVIIVARFKDIVLGSAIGAVGGWFLYHEKLRENAEVLLKGLDEEEG